MDTAEFIRTTITGPRSSCQVDLEGIGDMFTETTTAVYLLIDAERPAGWHLGPPGLHPDTPVRVIHAISRWAGGEVRGWIWTEKRLYLRHPASPESWPELDALVEKALGASRV